MAVVLGRLGYRMRNDLVVNVPVVRSRTKLRNAVLHLIAIPWSAFRVLLGPLGRNSRSERDTATKPRPIWTRAEQLAATAVAGIGVGTIVRIAIRGSITLGAVSVLLGVLGFTIPFRREPTAFGRGLALVLTPIEFGLAGVLWGQSMLACLASFGAGATVGLLVAPTSAIAATLPAGPRRPRRYGWVIVAPVAVFWAVAVAWSGANNPAAAWFGHTTSHGTRGSDAVAITFDDGPNDTNTAAISDLFASRGAKATFFMVGSAVEARPELARRLAAQGQVIGNHSYRHGPDDWMDPAYPELRRGESAFARVIGRCPRFFRPPFGRHTPAMAEHVEQMGMQMITWDVSASDWTTRDPALIAHRILHRVKPGSIVLLHDGSNGRPSVDRAFMVQAVTLVLDGLESRNLHPVGLDDLLHQTAWLPSCPAS
jgi:peptidoglycan/xylan/chitin deacetylase (PgdA/CDA1 family)